MPEALCWEPDAESRQGADCASLPAPHQINTLREFELLGEEAPSPLLLERLRSCCLVVEALGYQVRTAQENTEGSLERSHLLPAPARSVLSSAGSDKAGIDTTKVNVQGHQSPLPVQARDELIDTVCKREMGVYTQASGAALLRGVSASRAIQRGRARGMVRCQPHRPCRAASWFASAPALIRCPAAASRRNPADLCHHWRHRKAGPYGEPVQVAAAPPGGSQGHLGHLPARLARPPAALHHVLQHHQVPAGRDPGPAGGAERGGLGACRQGMQGVF